MSGAYSVKRRNSIALKFAANSVHARCDYFQKLGVGIWHIQRMPRSRQPFKMSERQLVSRKLSEQLAAIQAERDRAVTQATAQAVADAMWRYFDQDRVLFKAGECDNGVTFCRVGNAVLKVCSQSLTGDLVYNVARNVLHCSRDRVSVTIAPATEGDLLDALEVVKGSARLSIQEFLRIVRDQPAEPTLIKIVNASEINATPKVLTVKRDDSGKLSGAISQPIN